MSTIAENWNLLFYAEGDDAAEYLDLLEDEGPADLIDDIVSGKLDDIDEADTPEPEDDDDEEFEHDDGYVLVYNRRLERIWIFELDDIGLLGLDKHSAAIGHKLRRTDI